MSEEILKLEKRELVGKKVKGLRASGKIPSVIYGKEVKLPILTESEYNITEKLVGKSGYHSPISLDAGGKKHMAMVKKVAIDPVKRRILNIEFQAVSANQAVEATTPIVILNFGDSAASKASFEISQVLEDIEIKAKPSDLVPSLEIDAGGLNTLEDKLSLSDLKLPKGIEFADPEIDMETTIAVLYDPVVEAAAREAEEIETKKAAEGEMASPINEESKVAEEVDKKDE